MSSINKKELKNSSRDFRTVASRVINSDFDAFDSNLKRLMHHIESKPLIKEYIESYINEVGQFDIEKDFKQVSNGYGQYIFDSFIEEDEEISYIYQLLKYITDNSISYRVYVHPYSTSTKWQDKVKGFNDKVVLPFVNSIEGNYERICVEMGYDDDSTFNITVNGGQVNLAKDNSTIIATQNNNAIIDELVEKIKKDLEKIPERELQEEIIDNVEGIQEEIKKDIVKKGKLKSFVSSLQSILPKIGTAIELTAEITQIITFAQTFIK